MNFDNIPLELRERPQWVAWSMVTRGGRQTKLPVNPRTMQLAKTNDPSTWGTFEQAVKAGSRLNGIGYVFSADDPYCGIDLDDTPDTDLLHWFDSYTERSVSGRGAHIIIRAKVDQGRHLEHGIFSERRYFIMTGDLILDRPIAEAQTKVDQFVAAMFGGSGGGLFDGCIEEATAPPLDTLSRIRASHQAGKFERLWAGETSEYSSGSEADAALLSILRYWTGGDRAESFRLFESSALGKRAKWIKRLDYRERTWQAIDSGEVYNAEQRHYATPAAPPIVRRLSPWQSVTSADVRCVIAGTALEPLVELFESPMNPPLPLESSLLKSIIVAGCALSGKDESPGDFRGAMCRGHDIARLKIQTAGGQVCNIYGLLVARSGAGKDVGGLMDTLTLQRGWMIGTAGSAEGLADILSREKPFRGNGFLGIDEFSAWLDKRHWQSKAAAFLTSAFSRGWFSMALSERNGTKDRESMYCFPSILANVQPESLTRYASLIDIGTGFLSRFLVGRMPDTYFGRPVCRQFDLEPANTALDCFASKVGVVEIGDGYLDDLYAEFRDHKAAIPSHWGRLVNEYGPRLAVMLSTTDDTPEVSITSNHWSGVATIIRWLYSQADDVLGRIHEDERTAQRESLLDRVYARISRDGSATSTDITRSVQRGTTQKQRAEAIDELISRGLIRVAPADGNRGVTYEVVR